MMEIVYNVVHGSRAYGLDTEKSDFDFKGVGIPGKEFLLGVKNIEQEEYKTLSSDISRLKLFTEKGVEGTIYEFKKFCKLAADCNPNIIEMLYVENGDVLTMTSIGAKLRGNRDWFLSKKAKHTFSGYAVAQARRIKTHYDWINDPPEKQPQRLDYKLPDQPEWKTDVLNAILAIPSEMLLPEIRYVAIQEKAYHKDLRRYNEYVLWKKNRNAVRADMEMKHGFDTKFAMHLCRLLTMGIEILNLGTVIVKRPDRGFLLDVRNGKYTYDWIMKWQEDKLKELDSLYDKSTLQHQAQYKKINEFILEVLEGEVSIVLER